MPESHSQCLVHRMPETDVRWLTLPRPGDEFHCAEAQADDTDGSTLPPWTSPMHQRHFPLYRKQCRRLEERIVERRF